MRVAWDGNQAPARRLASAASSHGRPEPLRATARGRGRKRCEYATHGAAIHISTHRARCSFGSGTACEIAVVLEAKVGGRLHGHFPLLTASSFWGYLVVWAVVGLVGPWCGHPTDAFQFASPRDRFIPGRGLLAAARKQAGASSPDGTRTLHATKAGLREQRTGHSPSCPVTPGAMSRTGQATFYVSDRRLRLLCGNVPAPLAVPA